MRTLTPGAAEVWVVRLDVTGDGRWLAPTTAEAAAAARFVNDQLRRRYLRSHAALRAILGQYTAVALEFAEGQHGKPYLPATPELRFNLSHSQERALVAVACGVEIGVDVEWSRPMSDCLTLAERFFPPSEAAAFAAVAAEHRERDFFRRWTHIEALLKARGVGLYGVGEEAAGEWTVEELDAGPGYAGAVAVAQAGACIATLEFEGA